MCEEGVVPGEGQDPLLHHGALHVVIHENHVLLQSLHSEELAMPLELGQQHLGSQRDSE